MAWLAAFLLILLVSGCTSTSPVERSGTRNTASAEDAFVFPPVGGPSIVGVIEGKRGGGAYQEILLSTSAETPGQNRFQVTVIRNAASVVDPAPRIAREMRAALPGIRLTRSPFYVQNRYGPFGYAVGRGAGRDLCLFGWQSIRSKASLMTNQGVIDVRLRLCETGATEQKLLSVMYGYTIDVFINSAGWNPYGGPLPPSAELGKRGADILPVGPDQFATVVAPVPPAQAPQRPRPQAVQPLVAPPVVSIPTPTGPLVPPPPSGGDAAPSVPSPTAPIIPAPPEGM